MLATTGEGKNKLYTNKKKLNENGIKPLNNYSYLRCVHRLKGVKREMKKERKREERKGNYSFNTDFTYFSASATAASAFPTSGPAP